MRLDVPLIRQSSKLDCGQTCAEMLLKFFWVDVKTDRIKQAFSEQGMTTPPQLALAIGECSKLKPNLVFFNYQYFDAAFNSLNKEDKLQFIESLKTENEIDDKFIKHAKELIATDLGVEFCLITTSLIRNILSKGCPIITLVSVREFRGIKTAEWKGHFIIITGYDADCFYYNDPHWADEKFGQHKIGQEPLLVSMCKTRFPSLIYVSKNVT